jgi:hypothetical protein
MGYFWATSLVSLVSLSVALFRLAVVLRRGPKLSSSAQRQIWFYWGALLCFAFGTTIFHPFVLNWLKTVDWLITVPRAFLALTAYILGAHICYEFAPPLRPKWNWPLYVGIFTMVVYAVLAWLTVSSFYHLKPKGLVPDLVFNVVIVTLIMRVVIPSFIWAWQHDGQEPMRLRFLFILVFHLVVAVWVLTKTAEDMLLALGISLDFAFAYTGLGILLGISFPAHFVPMQYFVLMSRALNCVVSLWDFLCILVLEASVNQWIGRVSLLPRFKNVLKSPGEEIYWCVIAIFDARKLLKWQAQVSSEMRTIGEQLDRVVQLDPEYPDLVRELSRIGQSLIWFYLVKRWRLEEEWQMRYEHA